MDPKFISELAALFRNHGDEVLEGEIKFSVSGEMLRALNDSFSLIVREGSVTPPGQKSRDFIVTAGTESRSPVFFDLQLIYDFVQILSHLHINQLVTDQSVEGTVDLINFRNLQKLEIQKLPVQKLVSLRRLRNQLSELSCQQCLKHSQDILLFCGGDRAGEQVWTELRVINFSYNGLEQIDDSFRWTPWVHTLNLSHNCLTTASLLPLKCLPNLKSLDLSYNKLEAIPELSSEASRKLRSLKLQANSIHSISELAGFDGLTDLDLSSNCLLFDETLAPLSALASLRVLSLLRNPLAFTPRHRMVAINCLHSNTSTVKFILNGIPMTKAEKKHTGGLPSYANARRPSRIAANPSVSIHSQSVNNMEASIERSAYSDRMTDSVGKKKSRVREILLSDELNDGNEVPVVVGSPRKNLSSRKKTAIQSDDHLETKKQIEELRDKFGSNWLNADGENIVKEVFPTVESSEDEAMRRKILIDEMNDDSVLSSTPKEGMASRLEITDDQLNSTAENYGTASERTVTEGGGTTDGGTTTAAYESALSKEEESSDLTGLDFFQSQHSVEEEIPEPNEVEYYVEKLRTVKDETGWKLLLVVSDLSIKEKDPMSNEVINRWGLTVMESCERPSNRSVISIHFNTMRSDKKQRFYLMADEAGCLKLTSYLRDILANRDWDEFNQAVYKCANCTTQFCIDKMNTKALEKLKCPDCKSSLVIEITETNNNKLKNPTVQKVQSLEQEEQKKMPIAMAKSNSHSSIGSAASLNESSSCSKISNPPASSIDSNESVAGSSTSQRDKDADINSRRLGMDSDVEILSNPSQSSIEVLNTCSKNSSRKHSSEERRNVRFSTGGGPSGQQLMSQLTAIKTQELTDPDIDMGDAEQVVDSTNIAVANKLLGNCQLQALTESSSSGSITESICTQYEPAAAVEEHTAVEEELPAIVDDNDQSSQDGFAVGFKKSSSTFLEGFLKNLSSAANKAAADGIRVNKAEPFLFHTPNFQRADHRLQLYLLQNVFLEANEKFNSVIRGWLVKEEAQKVEDAIIVLSNKVVYLFVVTAEEEDDPGQWLRLMRRVEWKDWLGVRVLPFDVGIRFCFSPSAGGNWNVLLQDGQHTRNYLRVIEETEKRCDGEMDEEQKGKLKDALKIAEGGEEDQEELLMVAPFKGLTKIVNENAQGVEKRSALVVTNRKFAVLSGNWMWLLEGRAKDRPEVLFQLSLTDMIELEEGKKETDFVLNFMDEQENRHELWCLEFETKHTAQRVLDAIKGPWEKAFNQPLVDK